MLEEVESEVLESSGQGPLHAFCGMGMVVPVDGHDRTADLLGKPQELSAASQLRGFYPDS